MTAAERCALTGARRLPGRRDPHCVAGNQVKQSTLDRLVERGLVETRQRKFANPPSPCRPVLDHAGRVARD
jgi:hypothetical protein